MQQLDGSTLGAIDLSSAYEMNYVRLDKLLEVDNNMTLISRTTPELMGHTGVNYICIQKGDSQYGKVYFTDDAPGIMLELQDNVAYRVMGGPDPPLYIQD